MAISSSIIHPYTAFSSSHHSSPPLHSSSFFPSSSKTTPFPAFSSRLLIWQKNGDGIGGIRLKVKADYTKRRMETPGAFEMIDDESGERVIVWGDDSSIPSKEVLSWKPDQKEKRSQRGGGDRKAPSSSSVDNVVSDGKTRRVASSFGRLKALKIRSRARNVSQEKLETHSQMYDEVGIEDSDSDDDEMSDSQNILNKRKKNVNVKGGLDSLQDDERSREPSVSTNDVLRTGLNASVSHSRGWSGRDASRGFRNESRDQKYEGSRNEPRNQKYNQKYSGGSDFFSRKSFKDLGCSDDMIESLRAQGFLRPSNIQAMSYVPVMTGKSCIVADQSGSGKTLAYLAPVIQRLRQEEIEGLSKSASQSPRTVLLVPTAELASQVLRNCRSISRNGVPFRSMVATGGFRQRTQLESLEQDLDVLIATPGRFTYLIREGFLKLTNLRCALLDEVDILFNDEDFEQALQILMNSAPFTTQYLFVTATLPVEVYNKLVEIFPDSEVIMGPGMHRTSSGLEEVLVDCSGNEGSEKTPDTAFSNKKSALLKLAEENQVSRTIVFCNKIETCRKVENSLRRLDRKENQIQVLPFHAALEQETRIANMKNFLNQGREDHRSLFLICTDRASRGIDFPSVDHVVLFDFPRDPSEYVRRVGRTARGAGGKGKAYVFVVGKQVSLARRIIERNLKGHPLHDVPSAYELVR